MTFSAALFAGGASRRMGRDKAMLSIDGEVLWQRQVSLLKQLSPERICVSARSRPEWLPKDLEFVPDNEPSRGPLSGLAATLQQLTSSHLVVLAVDLPRMTAAHLRRLLSLAKPGCAVVPGEPDFFETMCAIYPAEAVHFLDEALASPDVSLQHFVHILDHENRVHVYPVSDAERPLYLNINRPEDLPA